MRQAGSFVWIYEWRRAIFEIFRSYFVPHSHVIATIVAHCLPSDPIQLFTKSAHMLTEDKRSRFWRRRVVFNDYNAKQYVLFETQRTLSTICRTPPQDIYLCSPPLCLTLLNIEPTVRSAEHLLQMAFWSTNDFNRGQLNSFDEVIDAFLTAGHVERLRAELSTQFVHEPLFLWMYPVALERRF